MTLIDRFKPVHPFPARMAPSIALDELAKVKGKKCVLDPMAGSGTTLVVARSRGHYALGYDSDPLASLIADVWCADIRPAAVEKAVTAVIAHAKNRMRTLPQSQGYPSDANDETRRFVRYWFDATNRRQLRALTEAITVVADKGVQKVLWCAFSRLIIAKSRGASRALDLSHSRPHRDLEKSPYRPIPNFARAVKAIVANAPFPIEKKSLPKAKVSIGDARNLPVKNSTVDVVITSPPYLNAIDYMRCNKFSLIWMGHQIPELRALRSGNIGTEVSSVEDSDWLIETAAAAGNIEQLPTRDQRMFRRYVNDMNDVISEISRVLKPSGRCVLVIGDCTMRGIYVRNSAILRSLGQRHGLQTVSSVAREIPANRRYLPPPSSHQAGANLQGRMREEIVMTLVSA